MRQLVVAIGAVAAFTGCSPAAVTDATGNSRQSVEAHADWADGDPTKPIEVYVVLQGPAAAEVLPRGVDVGHPTAVAASRARLLQLQVLRDGLRPELLARGAVVFAELSRLANAFHLRVPRGQLRAIAALPEVRRVEPVPTFHRFLKTALPIVGAPNVWSSGTSFHGEGVKLGILDTGVDYLHADLGGAGDPAHYEADDRSIIESGSFPTVRVVDGWDFVGDDYDPSESESIPVPDPDPNDCGGHGTHVAGIAAGNGVLLDGTPFGGPYDQSFDPAAFQVAPGVAPKASIYAIKIFGCDGSTTVVASGLEWAADPNLDGNFDDHLDVVNASLGSSWGVHSPVQEQLIENLTSVGCLLVASAGNEGSTFFITGSPASFDHVLSVAASVDSAYSTLTVDAPSTQAADYAGAQAQFSAPLETTGPIVGEVIYGSPPLGCEPFDNATDLAGNVAFVDRGDCLFLTKFDNAEAAGASAIVVANYSFGASIFSMAPPDADAESSLPGVMVSAEDGLLIKDSMAAGPTTVTLSAEVFGGTGAELIAGLSSRGPRNVGSVLKPEIAAPGVGIDSANVGSGIDPTAKSGTSMASPFVAGAAALLRQAHPELSPIGIKALLMNTAVSLNNEDGIAYPVSMQGSGRVDVAAAVTRRVTAAVQDGDGLVAISFGSITADQPISESRTAVVTNHGSEPVTYSLSAQQTHPLPGVGLSLEPQTLTVPPGQQLPFSLALHFDPQSLGVYGSDPVTPATQNDIPRHWLVEAAGHVYLNDQDDAQSLVLPFHASVRAGAWRQAEAPLGCAVADQPSVVSLALSGDSAHPHPIVTAFELGEVDEQRDDVGDEPELKKIDLRAVGVATDVPVADAFAAASLYFGVAVDGEWSTPALGPYSLFGIQIDSDGDEVADYTTVVEPRNRDDPWSDVLVATTYDLETCEDGPFDFDACTPIDRKRYINMVPANAGDTQPFHNNVAVLSVFASDVGLSERHTQFHYRAFTRGLLGISDMGNWVPFDAAAPAVDPARHAPIRGRPLYTGDEDVQVQLGTSPLPKLLLLHHNNIVGTRWEVVDVESFLELAVMLEHNFPKAVVVGQREAHNLHVGNPSTQPLKDVKVEATLGGGTLSFVAPSQGSCRQGAVLDCDLGTIAPESTVTLTIQYTADVDAGAMSLDVDTSAASACASTLSVSVDVVDEVAVSPPLSVHGGCGCRMARDRHHDAAPWLLVALALGLRRRRR